MTTETQAPEGEERAAFEAYMRREHPGIELRIQNLIGTYTMSSVNSAWEGWQARAAQPAPAEGDGRVVVLPNSEGTYTPFYPAQPSPAEAQEIGEVTWQQAADAIDDLDDFARMMVGVDPTGPRETLYRYLEQTKAALAVADQAPTEGDGREALFQALRDTQEACDVSQCPWCGCWGQSYAENDKPSDYCHHDQQLEPWRMFANSDVQPKGIVGPEEPDEGDWLSLAIGKLADAVSNAVTSTVKAHGHDGRVHMDEVAAHGALSEVLDQFERAIRSALATQDPAPAPQARFANVSCSQCRREFGPGNAGFSHCQDHQGGRHELPPLPNADMTYERRPAGCEPMRVPVFTAEKMHDDVLPWPSFAAPSEGDERARESDRQLMDFYSVESLYSLIDAQEEHIRRLQAKLPADNQPAFTRVREG